MGSVMSESWDTVFTTVRASEGSSVDQILERWQKYSLREWAAHRGMHAVTSVGQSRTFCEGSECPLLMQAAGFRRKAGTASAYDQDQAKHS